MRRGTNPVLTFELPEAITISALYTTATRTHRMSVVAMRT